MGRFGTRLPSAAKDECWSEGRTSLESKEGIRDGCTTEDPRLLEVVAVCAAVGSIPGAVDTCTCGITKGCDTGADVVTGVEATTGCWEPWAPGGIPV